MRSKLLKILPTYLAITHFSSQMETDIQIINSDKQSLPNPKLPGQLKSYGYAAAIIILSILLIIQY